MIIAGKTENGSIILKGIFKLYETEGIPLDTLFDALQEKNSIPDWGDFVIEAVRSGMKPERVISMLESSITDSFGSDYSKIVINRLIKGFEIPIY